LGVCQSLGGLVLVGIAVGVKLLEFFSALWGLLQ
jgi:hypothetical protein